MTNNQLDQILRKFPYSGWNDQEKRLAKVLLNFPGLVKDVEENTDITRNTMQEIRDTWYSLPKEEQKILFDHLTDVASRLLEKQIRVDEAVEA